MSEARDLAEAHYRSFNERDFSRAAEIYSPDLVTIEPGSGTMEGIDAFMAHTSVFTTGFPDAQLEVLSVTDGDDRVVIEGCFVGTNTGPLLTPNGELPPTGRGLRLPYCDVWHAEAGRITKHQIYYDQMGFLAQLGLIPEPAAAS
jgi:steroid delta-isomerase-like uncharacterized protein